MPVHAAWKSHPGWLFVGMFAHCEGPQYPFPPNAFGGEQSVELRLWPRTALREHSTSDMSRAKTRHLILAPIRKGYIPHEYREGCEVEKQKYGYREKCTLSSEG